MTTAKNKIVKLTVKSILYKISNAVNDIFVSSHPIYRKQFIDYLKREHTQYDINESIRNLKRFGYIKEFIVKNKRYFKLSKKGIKRIKKFHIDDLKLKKFSKWNKKWQVVVFDIPEKMKLKRDIFRENLKRLGFKQYQKSIYLYPFKCIDEIKLITEYLKIKPYVLIMVSDIIENEDKIIDFFIINNILNKNQIMV